jgi:dsRNA-specific ribonuclease
MPKSNVFFKWEAYHDVTITTQNFLSDASATMYAELMAKGSFVTSIMKGFKSGGYELKIRGAAVKNYYDVIITPKSAEMSPDGVALKITTNNIEAVLCAAYLHMENEKSIQPLIDAFDWYEGE